MKFDTSGIDLPDFVDKVATAYNLPLVAVEFVPKGEDAFCYVVSTAAGNRYFVRAKPHDRGSTTELVYEAVAALHGRVGIVQVLAPHRTIEGTFGWNYGPYLVTLLPFVEGTTIQESGITEGQIAESADIIAALHASDPALLPPLPLELFANPFEQPIRKALTAALSLGYTASGYQQRVGELLRIHQSDVLATLDLMRRVRRASLRVDPPLAPTHGDPNEANFLVDRHGALHLTDWGWLALGPRERDLTFFTGDHFEAFLRHYLDRSGPIRLHRQLFAFYSYRWALQEIADYTGRILFGTPTPDEAEHAWQELQPYLPVPHEGIEDGLAFLLKQLRRFTGDGGLDFDES